MNKLLPFLFILFSAAVYGQLPESAVEKGVPWALYHAIEKKLDSVFYDDQAPRTKLEDPAIKSSPKKTDSLWNVIAKKDSINLGKVTAVLDQYGWLGTDDIGGRANRALFLVIQHASLKIQLQYLPMMRQAVKNGKARGEDLALLEDRVLTKQGKPQLYGSQVRPGKTGKYEFFPIEDERNVNQRRASVGLEPLEVYARNFAIDYHLPK